MVKNYGRCVSLSILVGTGIFSVSNLQANNSHESVSIRGEYVDEAKIESPDAALTALKQGNQRFVENRRLEQNYTSQVAATKSGQHPYAVILSCIDSRVPPEIVFDQGIGDVFVARVAGNIENRDILGSLEFATKVKGSKLILVLGHRSCGAIEGACADVKLGNLTGLLSDIKPAIRSIAKQNPQMDKKSKEFSELVGVENVRQTMRDIEQKSPTIRDLTKSGKVKIVGAIYDVATGKVEFL